MTFRNGWLSLLLLTPLCVSPLAAQAIEQPPDKPLYVPSLIGVSDGAVAGITIATLPRIPFSATVSVENRSVSRDGKVHVQHLTGEVARNSRGSTRTVVDLNELGAPVDPTAVTIHIYDAARKADITIFPAAKSALYRPEEIDAKVYYPLEPRPKQPAIQRRFHSPTPPGQPFPTVQTQRQDLGTQTIDGRVLRHGRETLTFPAALTPDKRGFTSVTDYWYDQSLQAFVLIKRSVSNHSTQTIVLRSIRRQNPDPSLFQIPADYQVTQVNMEPWLNPGFCPLP
ncbi:MAG TPA: hypothetical protein VJX70_01035 [Candidatus Acidoferrum sp.]|nr:hypothetical protein [Candidatus Acidoferrum sp.]